jgi:hypothetical protein
MHGQSSSHRRAVGDHGGVQLGGQGMGDGKCGGAPIEDNCGARVDQGDGCRRRALLAVDLEVAAAGVVDDGRRSR